MLIKVLNEYKVSLYEILTMSFFIGISYAYLSKIFLYEILGVSWLLGNLTPNYVLISSLGFIFSTLIGIGIGLSFPEKRLFLITNSLFLIATIFFYILFSCFDFLSGIMGKNYNYLPYAFWCLVCAYCVGSIRYNLYAHNSIKKLGGKPLPIKFFVGIFLVMMVVGPSWLSKLEGKKVIEKPNIFFNKVTIKKDQRKWFLIEFINDKALIKLDSKKAVYKFVEYKDIDLYE